MPFYVDDLNGSAILYIAKCHTQYTLLFTMTTVEGLATTEKDHWITDHL